MQIGVLGAAGPNRADERYAVRIVADDEILQSRWRAGSKIEKQLSVHGRWSVSLS